MSKRNNIIAIILCAIAFVAALAITAPVSSATRICCVPGKCWPC